MDLIISCVTDVLYRRAYVKTDVYGIVTGYFGESYKPQYRPFIRDVHDEGYVWNPIKGSRWFDTWEEAVAWLDGYAQEHELTKLHRVR